MEKWITLYNPDGTENSVINTNYVQRVYRKTFMLAKYIVIEFGNKSTQHIFCGRGKKGKDLQQMLLKKLSANITKIKI